MARRLSALFASRSSWFDVGVFGAGLIVVGVAGYFFVDQGLQTSPWVLLTIPLIVIIARFPMILDRGEGGVEVGFDSSILMFLLCRRAVQEALVIWSVGVVVTQADLGEAADGQAVQRRCRHPRRRRVGAAVHVRPRGDRLGRPAARRGARGHVVLRHRLPALGAVGRRRDQDRPPRLPAAARHPARHRLLRALRLARLPGRRRASAATPVVDAPAAGGAAGHPAGRDPGRSPAAARTPAGSACSSTRRSAPRRCPTPGRSSTRWSTTPGGCCGSAQRRGAHDAAGRRRDRRPAARRPAGPLDRRARRGTAPAPPRPPTSRRSRRWRRSPPTPSRGSG